MNWKLLVLLLVFIFVGAGWRRFDEWMDHRRALQRHRLGIRPAPPEPVCGCQHHLAFHDRVTGRCGAPAQQVTEWEWNEEEEMKVPVRWTTVPCPCKQYCGPATPVSTLHTPLVPGTEAPAAVDLEKAAGDAA